MDCIGGRGREKEKKERKKEENIFLEEENS
jgi:hypothetical protein